MKIPETLRFRGTVKFNKVNYSLSAESFIRTARNFHSSPYKLIHVYAIVVYLQPLFHRCLY